MDLKRNSSVGITEALISAVLEWVLMFMIFVDAAFSYTVTRFAGYCRLRVPCVLCSRLGDSRDLMICHKHKHSSLVLCRQNCDNCFFSLDEPSRDVEYTKMATESESSISDTASPTSPIIREMETHQIPIADFPEFEKLIPPVVESDSHQTVESETPLEPSQLVSFSEATPSHDRTQGTYATSMYVECGEGSNVDSDPSSTFELRNQVNMKCGETSAVGDESSEILMDSKQKNCPQVVEPLDLGEAYRFAVSTKGRQLSGKFLEQQKSMADSTRASEDLKLLLSQISFSRGIELSLHDTSPRDASSGVAAMGLQIIQRRMSLERNESSLSLDGSTVSEIEGESVVDRLKRQVEHDKKIMSSLYKELEEEINASAIAANQAMAMITRLQEEKASLHTEALQYLRMMEEQSEYEGEALQNANDLLAEKEKQIQDLEYELQLYRNRFGDVSFSNTFDKPKTESEITQKLDADCGGTSDSNNDKRDIANQNSLEDEKQYLLQCLRKLENKLFIFANPADMIDGEKKLVLNGGTEQNHPLKEIAPKDLSGNENSRRGNKLWSSPSVGDTELNAFRHELSVMNNRLEALEAEKNVLECSFNSLEKGSEGLEFIREIVSRLQELHSDYIGTRDDSFA